MLKNIFLKINQARINRLKPKVNIILTKNIPTPSLFEVSNLAKIVSIINSYEEELEKKPDSFFKEKTLEYKKLIYERTKDLDEKEYKEVLEKTFDEILPFYFAMVREASKRTTKLRHFDVQLLGGIVLHKNKIAEMVTGEGKTLVATLAASLNALADKGVHIVTVNDYLAKRDREWMGPIYEFLGLSVGVIQHDMDKSQRKKEYSCDIIYGTNSEFGFDYLRDNMAMSLDDIVQRGHFYAIVDEVDSILIDEARTPLIISGPSEVSVEKYYKANSLIKHLNVKTLIESFQTKDGLMVLKNTDGSQITIHPTELEEKYDAIVEEKSQFAYLTEKGEKKCLQLIGVNSLEEAPDNFSNPWLHYIINALRAHFHFKKDVHYIVKDGKVIIVDEFTGRLMPGRRWSDGIHQAIEAKENLKIEEESQTLATISLQNYFRMYKKLAGMTGTAYTEANEFKHIYKLDVVVIPTNKPLRRINYPDRIYKTKKAKFDAVVKEIEELYKIKRPVLVGTTSIEDSEYLSFLLEKKGIPHNVLNAKYHEKEAYIIAQAGRLSQITIATNMAGRGTDIILGGNIDYFIKDLLKKNNINQEDLNYKEEYEKLYNKYKKDFEDEHKKVVDLGGLHIIGTQRHESRRIDNQLRGRAGRQGDLGSSRFYISLEDDLMRLFGSERIYFLMDRFGFKEDEPIEHPLINRSLEIAQKRVEEHNFEIRKQLLEYDTVMNTQREIIYKQRRNILESENIRDYIIQMIDDVLEEDIPKYFEEQNLIKLIHWFKQKFNLEISINEINNFNEKEAIDYLKDKLKKHYETKEKNLSENIRIFEKVIALWSIDTHFKEHLLIMDSLREGIHLRGYAQVEPLVEYQKESYAVFEDMIKRIKETTLEFLFKSRFMPTYNINKFENTPQNTQDKVPQKEIKFKDKKVKRNDPCPCGSGKKYKKCCGK